MNLVEQAIQAETEYKEKMKEATDRLKHIQSFLGLMYINEEIIGVKSVSFNEGVVHLIVDCSIDSWGIDEEISIECDIPFAVFNANDEELNDYRNLLLAINGLDKLQESRDEYNRNLETIKRCKREINSATNRNKKLEEKYGDLVK